MIARLLIANRGEIAVRIAATARRLGIENVGVYSEADRRGLHLDHVDVAVALPGESAADSYLRGDLIIEIALAEGCDAVHPGYGFLAENALFADAVTAAGLVWIGPTAQQMTILGDKISAKRVAIAAGVPTASIYEVTDGLVPSDVPMPALVKATAGGGGRGMRIVREHADLAGAIESAAREAESSFGNAVVFVEPFIEHGRHIEVQVIGDAFGNIVHLGERECSIQRRNQKIVEEAPSPSASDELRQTLCESAVRLARHVGYQSLGTIEFLVGADDSINFLEANTRVQVEHPVTELVTGFDLIELQLRIASAERLPFTQADVIVSGHAIEARIVAEDPAENWRASVGTLTMFDIDPSIRVDTGVKAGSEMSSNYDSLLAKAISHAADRPTAARQLRQALLRSRVSGCATNLDCLVAILGEADFLRGETPITYLADHPGLAVEPAVEEGNRLMLVLAATMATCQPPSVWAFALPGWRNLRTTGQRVVWSDRFGMTTPVEYTFSSADIATVAVGPWPSTATDGSLTADDRRVVRVRIRSRADGRVGLEVDGRATNVDVTAYEDLIHTVSPSGQLEWRLRPSFDDADHLAPSGDPRSPLPGTIIAVHVAPGDTVEAGDKLVVVEAMKMEYAITADRTARVASVSVSVGDRVAAGQVVAELLDA